MNNKQSTDVENLDNRLCFENTIRSIHRIVIINVTFGKPLHFVTVSTVFSRRRTISNRLSSKSNIRIPRIPNFIPNELPKIDFLNISLPVVIFQRSRCDACNENLYYEKEDSLIFFSIEEIVVPPDFGEQG